MLAPRVMLTVAATVAAALPRATAFAPSPALAGMQRARVGLRGRMGLAPHSWGRVAPGPRAQGVRMVATEPEAKTEEVQPSPDFKFNMEDITGVCKRRGFIFQSSEIYQGSIALSPPAPVLSMFVCARRCRSCMPAPMCDSVPKDHTDVIIIIDLFGLALCGQVLPASMTMARWVLR